MQEEQKPLWKYFFDLLCCVPENKSNSQNELQTKVSKRDKPNKLSFESNEAKKNTSKDNASDKVGLIGEDANSPKQSIKPIVSYTVHNEITAMVEHFEDKSENHEETFTETYEDKREADQSTYKLFEELEEELKLIHIEIVKSPYTSLFENKIYYEDTIMELKKKISDIPDNSDMGEDKTILSVEIETCWKILHSRLSTEKQSPESIRYIEKINKIAAKCDTLWSEIESLQNNISEKDHLYYDEMLLRLLLELDMLDVVNQPDVRSIRREVLRKVQEKIAMLTNIVRKQNEGN